MDKIKIAILVGTVRANRESIKVAHYVDEFAKKYTEVDVNLVDPQSLTLVDEGQDVKDPTYSKITQEADAFIIVTPEYNHSFPGSLKRVLDSEYDNYARKPVSLIGVSSGAWGGVRACEALLPVCHKLGLVNIRSELYFPMVQEIFGEAGELAADYKERYETNLDKLFAELIWFARSLKSFES